MNKPGDAAAYTLQNRRLTWLGSFNENLAYLRHGIGRARGNCDAISLSPTWADIDGLLRGCRDHSRRRREVMDVLVGGQVDGKLHEVGPNGQCGLGAGEPDVAVVVVANPGYGEQIRGESCKPAVVGGARLACRRQPDTKVSIDTNV